MNFFKYNRSEFRLFRLIKPIGWALFALGLIAFIICIILFIINLLKARELTIIDVSSNQNLVGAGLAKFVDETNGYNIFRKIYIFGYASLISLLFCIITRINTKFWVIIRIFNQYSSVAYDYYHDKKKLFISLFFNFISFLASIALCYCVWNILFILFGYVKNINNDYSDLYNKLLSLTNTNESSQFIQEFLQNAKNSINNLISNISIKQHFVYSIITLVMIAIWICSNLFYGLFLLLYIPKNYTYKEKEWSYLNMVDDSILKGKKLPVAKQMDYSKFNSKMTNGYSGKEQNIRDKQYDIFIKRNQTL